MKRIWSALLLLLTASVLWSRQIDLPAHQCSANLPESVEWTVLSSSQKGQILGVVSEDGKVVGSINVVEMVVPGAKEQSQYLAGHLHGLKKSGFVVRGLVPQNLGDFPGQAVILTGTSNGVAIAQTNWVLFTKERVYIVSGAVLGDVDEAHARTAAGFVSGFALHRSSSN